MSSVGDKAGMAVREHYEAKIYHLHDSNLVSFSLLLVVICRSSYLSIALQLVNYLPLLVVVALYG
jgi:hypothetical protein